jgi:hypothetical protein
MNRLSLLLASVCLLASGCTSPQRQEDYSSYIKYYKVEAPTDLTTQSCRGYGCRIVDTVTIKPRDWRYITEPIARKPRSAADERERLRWVMGRFENVIGAMTGTSADVPGTYLELGDEQQDCADESVNTTLYLLILQNHDLLRYHTVGRPGGRFPPHLTGVIVEKGTGMAYAVDTWFHFNGVRAEVLPLDEWKYGWHPEQEDLRQQDVQAPRTW